MDLRTLIGLVSASVAEHNPAFSSSQRRVAVDAMATQVALVISGIRSAYLPDVLSFTTDSLLAVLADLQPRAPSLVVLWNECVQQGFFVNSELLKHRIRTKDYPRWLSTASPSTLVPQPAFFQELINKLVLKPGSLELIDLSTTDMISFAGFLLEYPYVYVASAMNGPFLAGVSLFVYDCAVNLDGNWTSVIKFSVPEICATEDPCPGLKSKFGPRLNSLGLEEPVISRKTQVMDRVAL